MPYISAIPFLHFLPLPFFFFQYTQVDDFILTTRLMASFGSSRTIGVSTFVHIQWAKGFFFFHHEATQLFSYFPFLQYPSLLISFIEAIHSPCHSCFSLSSLTFSSYALSVFFHSSVYIEHLSYYVSYRFGP